MDPDEQLARLLQEEEDRAAAAAVREVIRRGKKKTLQKIKVRRRHGTLSSPPHCMKNRFRVSRFTDLCSPQLPSNATTRLQRGTPPRLADHRKTKTTRNISPSLRYSPPPRIQVAAAQQQQQRTAPSLQATQKQFNTRLESGVHTVLQYEDATARACALSVIPAERLEAEARALVGSSAANPGAAGSAAISLHDARLLRLLRWFKREFFTWCNNPPCRGCGCVDTEGQGMAAPSDEDRAHGASRVEAYRCPRCGDVTRFPRYNDAKKLLQTRTGRCGEWANAFTLCCRAMGRGPLFIHSFPFFSPQFSSFFHKGEGDESTTHSCVSPAVTLLTTSTYYVDMSRHAPRHAPRHVNIPRRHATSRAPGLRYEARWVLDWTDHVWTECWSAEQGRWLHCDSCEDACDTPLLYEQGWGKKLSYVVAFGKDGVADVTRRYTAVGGHLTRRCPTRRILYRIITRTAVRTKRVHGDSYTNR